MKVWSAVELFNGVIIDMKVFPCMEAASKYFHEYINSTGSVEDCDPDFYSNGEHGSFYWDDGTCNENEIHIWQIEMEE